MKYPDHIIKTTLTTNFSFKRLANNIEKVFEYSTDDIGQKASDRAKQNINEAKYAPLTNYTKGKRRQGIGWDNKKVPKVTHDIPLRQTDALYNSLEYNKKTKSIDMMAYGFDHNKGFVNPKGYKVPKRPFLESLYTGIQSSAVLQEQSKTVQLMIRKIFKDETKVYK